MVEATRATDPRAMGSRSPRGGRPRFTRRAGPWRLLPILSALMALTAMVVAAFGLRGGHDVSVGANLAITGRDRSAIIDANNSPTLVANPVRPGNLVVVNRIDRPGFSAALHWTQDGGRSWDDTPLPLPAGRDRPYAPEAAFDPQGTLYVLYVNLEGAGNDPQTLWLSRSHDGGRTLDPPTAVAGRLSFQARLAVDAQGRVYVTWLRATSVATLSMTGPATVVCAVSADGGSTFSEPVDVSDAQRQRVGAATPVVAPNGDVFVLYEDFRGDVRDFQNLKGPPWQMPFALVVSRSTSHGARFAPGVEVDAGLVPTQRFLVYLPRFPSMAAGPDGALYVAWSDGRLGSEQVFVRRSTDAGQTWGEATHVPTAVPGSGISAVMPKVSAAPDGRIDVLFLAGHLGGDGLVDADLASSDDAGTSFRTVRVSLTSFDSRIGPSTGPDYLAPDLGSRLGAASADGEATLAWVDTRLGTQDTGRQDIEVATVAMPATGPSAARLSLVGLLLLLAIAASLPVFLEAVDRRRARGRSA